MAAPIGKISKRQALAMPDQRVEALEGAAVALDSRQDFSREIGKLWSEARDRFVLIGRRLNEAKRRLAHGEWKILVERELPFSQGIAFQLRAVAEAIDQGRIPVDRIPASYSIAYQISTLNDDELKRAVGEGILRPDVSREEVVAFKRRVRRTPSPPPVAEKPDPLAALRLERDRLVARLRAINAAFLAAGAADDIVAGIGAAPGAATEEHVIDGTFERVAADAE